MKSYIGLVLFLGIFSTEARVLDDFLNKFIELQNKPTAIISFLKDSRNVQLGEQLTKCTLAVKKSMSSVNKDDNTLYVADLHDNQTYQILHQAQNRYMMQTPARWLLFFKANQTFLLDTIDSELVKRKVDQLLQGIYMGINTEIYIAINDVNKYHTYLVYRKNPKYQLIWEEYSQKITSLAMRRCNVDGLPVVVTTRISNNDTLLHFENYLYRQIDTLPKYTYYMTRHLVDFVNGTYVINVTDSWGYIQDDGQFNGMVRELEDGRADLGGTTFVPTVHRLHIVEFVLAPSKIGIAFMFKKPSLGSVTNIFVLPFSRGVWASIGALIGLFSLTLFFTSYREEQQKTYEINISKAQKLSDGVLDTFCLVFQQGTAADPISISTRQVLLLGLMIFMFLFTAYSANVVSLLQTTTNEINDVESLLKSPLKLGIQGAQYNKAYFPTDTRVHHQALWRQKLEPQGEKAIYTAEEGVRKLREGMFAFHVEATAGFDEVQKNFEDNEKCNLGYVKFFALSDPHLGVGRNSHIKEQLKIAARRVIETGLQERSSRRVVARRPSCGANVAMFSAVTLVDVAPAFKCLFVAYLMAILIVSMEIIVHSRVVRANRA